MQSECNSRRIKSFRSVRARDDEAVHKIEATKGVKDTFTFMLMSSHSGRFFLIYVNEAKGVQELSN